MEISTGRYRLGQGVSSVQKYNEVNKTYKTTDNGGTIQEGRTLSLGKTHIWPSYELDNAGSSTFKYVAPAVSQWGHMQGEFQFINGIEPSDKEVPIDPAGGHGQLTFNARESSLWHKLKVKVRVVLSGGITNKKPLNESIPGEFSLVSGTKTYLYDNGTSKDLTETKDCNAGLNISTEKKYITVNNPFYDMKIFDNINFNDRIIDNIKSVLSNENFQPKSETSTFSSVNNTIKVPNINNAHPISKTIDTKVIEYVIEPEVDHTKLHELIDKNKYDYALDYEISANNDTVTKYGYAEVVSYYAYDEGAEKEYPLEKTILLASWSQSPNILYYVNMAWVKKPSSKDSAPVVISDDDEVSVEYDDVNFSLYLFVELGVSPNGGNDIYWNQDYSMNGNSLSASMPTDIARYITITKTDRDETGYVKNYGNFSCETMWAGGNYVKVTGSSLPNTEANNKSRSQKYYVDNIENIKTLDTTILHWRPDINNPNKHLQPIRIVSAISDNTENRHVQSTTFNVKKITSTDSWKLNISANLSYGKYNGSTDGKSINER